jgi:hypothetical protein
MLAATLALTFFCVAERPVEPVPGKSAGEQPEKRWDALTPEQRSRLKHVYHQVPRSEWEKRAKEWERRALPPIERFPAHWRSYIVQNSFWARRRIQELPPEKRPGQNLAPEARVAALKEILRPLFKDRITRCRLAAEHVFSPFELRMLKQLPPSEREKIIARADRDVFGLVSPWSRQKLAAAGAEAPLVREYLLMPDALKSGDFVGRGDWQRGRRPPRERDGRREPPKK